MVKAAVFGPHWLSIGLPAAIAAAILFVKAQGMSTPQNEFQNAQQYVPIKRPK